MTVQVEKGLVTLTGTCGVEEAEPLLSALIEDPSRTVHLRAGKVHTALWQVLLATRAKVVGEPTDTFVAHHIFPLVLDRGSSAAPERRQRKPRQKRSEQ